MNIEEYRKIYNSDDADPGWEAIDKALKKIYKKQKPKHWAPEIYGSLGGPDPLDGISVYKSNAGGIEHYHFVTYGFSELYYSEEAVEEGCSKFEFELTFRLKPFELDKEYPTWPLNLLQNLARYVFESYRHFEEFHMMNANGPIRLETDTDITALAFCIDPELGIIDTPHGKVEFVQIYGITNEEYQSLKENGTDSKPIFDSIKASNPLFITDLTRKSQNKTSKGATKSKPKKKQKS